jgi:DNA-directed RNA polymerase specialized sigma24 family protein
VECRFFGGLTSAETADALGLSRRTVERDWTRARTHLFQILQGLPPGAPSAS